MLQGQGTFTVETKDDYWAEADENYNVKLQMYKIRVNLKTVKFG